MKPPAVTLRHDPVAGRAALREVLVHPPPGLDTAGLLFLFCETLCNLGRLEDPTVPADFDGLATLRERGVTDVPPGARSQPVRVRHRAPRR